MVKNKRSKPKNKTAEISEKKVGELVALAHQGTMESIKKISDFTKTAKNKNLKAMAEIAKDEAEYFYYSPTSEQEEKDLLLAKIIRDREDHLTMDLKCQAGAAKFELEKLDLAREIHKKLLKSLPKTKQKDWQYYFSEDHYQTIANRLQEIEKDIDYETNWIETAKKIIKTKKYLNLPPDFFKHYHWDYEGIDFWPNDSVLQKNNEISDDNFN